MIVHLISCMANGEVSILVRSYQLTNSSTIPLENEFNIQYDLLANCNCMVYWVTNSTPLSMRLFKEQFATSEGNAVGACIFVSFPA
jgi:hypothetical protein